MKTQQPETDPARDLAVNVLRANRRRVLCGAFGASAVAVLAACSSSDAVSDGADQPGGDGGQSGGEQSSAGGSGEAVAKLSDIPVGGGLAAAGLVLVQPEEGTVKAFDAACPHKGAQLAAPEDGTITCPAHGSQFAATDGAVTHGPATDGLTEVEVTVTDGQVFKA